MPVPDAEYRRLQSARQLSARLVERHALSQKLGQAKLNDRARFTDFLTISPAVSAALEDLGNQLFGELAELLESKLSVALQEVLEQPIHLRVVRKFNRGMVNLSFHVERNGQEENILEGQGGSVTNVLSVGLRLLSLTTLPESQHRRFLVLDEQDCWLRPDLVPRLVKIVHEAGKALGFQVLMISHHDVSAFENFAQKIYRLTPAPDGVDVAEVHKSEE
jgi:hypothetical protein